MKKRIIFPDKSLVKHQEAANYYLSSSQEQVYQSLITGFREEKIFFTLTGETGLGKSFLMECIINELGVKALAIKLPQRNDVGFFDLIAEEVDIDFSKKSTIAEKKAWLIRFFRRQLVQHIIIQVDSAQLITSNTLSSIINWVKLLSTENNHLPSIHVVLIGLPVLEEFPELARLKDQENKIICQCQLKSLNDDETPQYIHAYLKRLDKVATPFENSAVERVIFYSEGIPRLINQLCDLGLLIAELEDIPSINATVIDGIANDCLLNHKKSVSFVNQTTKQTSLLSITDNSNKVTIQSKDELKDSKQKINKVDASSIDSTAISTKKSFIFGLSVGFVFGVGLSIFVNQGWLYKENMISSYLKPVITQVMSLQQKVKEPVITRLPTKPGKQEDDQNKQQQSLQIINDDVTQKPKLISDDALQIIDKQKIVAVSQSVDLSERINKLFILAERQLVIKHLTTPVGDNALKTYQAILSLDANNKQALEGINTISKTYVTWARVEINKQNFQHAENLFKKALKVSPNERGALKGLTWLDMNKMGY